ncbi:MAG: hypothetical protein DRN06_06665 [Thermoprotei archaeon]|nr:MAG: hypothetical protein DRN06_06665 [Thermoprotei archaeon]
MGLRVGRFYKVVDYPHPDPFWSCMLIFEGDVYELSSHELSKIPAGVEILGGRAPVLSYNLRIIRFTMEMVRERRVRVIAGAGERGEEDVEEVIEPRREHIGKVRFAVAGRRAYVEKFDIHHQPWFTASELWDIFEEHVLKDEIGVREVFVYGPNCRVYMDYLFGKGYEEYWDVAPWILKKALR